jgi:hypothetical protein
VRKIAVHIRTKQRMLGLLDKQRHCSFHIFQPVET